MLLLAAAAITAPATVRSQAQAGARGPAVGDAAPGFALPGSTKDGKLSKPVHLSDFKGQVVVLAFFPKARTGG